MLSQRQQGFSVVVVQGVRAAHGGLGRGVSHPGALLQ